MTSRRWTCVQLGFLTENARNENVAPSQTQVVKMRDTSVRIDNEIAIHEKARHENAGNENSGKEF